MTLHGKGSIKFQISVLRVRAGDTRAILRMMKNTKYKLRIVDKKVYMYYTVDLITQNQYVHCPECTYQEKLECRFVVP